MRHWTPCVFMLLLTANTMISCSEAPTAVVWLEFDDDENGDGRLSPGETGVLILRIEDINVADNSTVRYTVSSPTNYLSITSGETGSCNRFGIDCKKEVKVTLLPNVPKGTTALPISVHVESRKANSSSTEKDVNRFDFSIGVSDANSDGEDAILATLSVGSDSNNDGFLNPGESARLSVRLTNLWVQDIEGVKYTLSSNSPHIEVTGNEDGSCYTIRRLEDGCSSTSTEIKVASPSLVTQKTLADLRLIVTDNAGNSWAVPSTVTIWPTAGQPHLERITFDERSNYLRIYLRNVGTSRIDGLTYRISSSTGLMLETPDKEYDCSSLNAGQIRECSSVVRLSALGTADVVLNVSDRLGNAWTLRMENAQIERTN